MSDATPDALAPIDDLRAAAEADLAGVGSPEALEAFRVAYLGSKGRLKGLMAGMKAVDKADKPAFGLSANRLKQELTAAFEAKQTELKGRGDAAGDAAGPRVDVTLPAPPDPRGRHHVISQTIDRITDAFARMGFTPVEGPEVEDEFHNFVALNIPLSHPARDPLDNFYLSDPDASNPALLRSQTSTVQVRTMERVEPPIRIVSLGRVYRPDEHDATHYSMFHQVEGLYVDRDVSMVDLKTTLVQFAHAMFGPDAEIDLVPSYFPFTEPSAELYVKIDLGKGPEWMEIGGCGMVDPAVFEHVGYDPEAWTGFAFGLGIERIAMRLHQIADIRHLFENDLRFLRRF
jgi:phenylalanyl-tRNA synthetase alpha chain